ncbi:uncharacterized protein LOC112514178 [Cynara cardunculus var. scolymus]|uniref:uncharacterized protein LOC112514178 n=1 Tax=Cynara cardunculus var. scolymus TaxID=59895 RepID=UPI000D62B3B5|nr:uncharacterized protein LOC112514178 [Cynara cardunculus var. scolymus]
MPINFEEFHGSPIGGPRGEYRTYQRIGSEVFWVGMKKDIVEMVKNCEVCQRNKNLSGSPARLLQPLSLPDKVWDEIFIRSNGMSSIMVVVDRLSKYDHFVRLKHPFNVQTVAEAFIKNIVRLHGVPRSVISDRDKVFLSRFWKELFRLQGTKLKFSSTYHPQSDGQTEVVNHCLEQYLRCWVSSTPKQWCKWLPWVELSYNTSFHTALKVSPFKVFYGRDPPPLLHYKANSSRVQSVDQELTDREEMLDEVKLHLLKAQFRMKQYADLKRKEVEFVVRDWVFLKLRPYIQKLPVMGNSLKLLSRFYGPYKMLEKIGSVAYRLDLPSSVKIHPISDELVLQAVPEDILDVRQIPNGDVGQVEVLVKWEGMSDFEASWENFEALLQQFPNCHIEDKDILENRKMANGDEASHTPCNDNIGENAPHLEIYDDEAPMSPRSERKEKETGDTSKPKTDRVPFKTFRGSGATEFFGKVDPLEAREWILNTEKVFRISRVLCDDKVNYLTTMFKSRALIWWNATFAALGETEKEGMPWESFKTRFNKQYCLIDLQERLEKVFLDLNQGKMSVVDYGIEFNHKAQFATRFLTTEHERVDQFIDGL